MSIAFKVHQESATAKARAAFEAERDALKPDAPQPSLTKAISVEKKEKKIPGAPVLSTCPSSAVQQAATVQWRESRRKMLNTPEVLM